MVREVFLVDSTGFEFRGRRFCRACLVENPDRKITLKPPARKSSRKKSQHDYASLHSGVQADNNKWMVYVRSKVTKGDPFQRLLGKDLTLEWINGDNNALTEPIIVEICDGLGMRMPERSLTVRDIASILGEDTPVEVMGEAYFSFAITFSNRVFSPDVSTQTNTPGFTLLKWAEYYSAIPSQRDKIRNVISLEISDTPLSKDILPPRIVRELDWVEKFWPSNRKGKGHLFPKVQLYCLMSVANAWTVGLRPYPTSAVDMSSLGLAHRFCRLFCLLSYTSWCESAYVNILYDRANEITQHPDFLFHPSNHLKSFCVRTMDWYRTAEPNVVWGSG